MLSGDTCAWYLRSAVVATRAWSREMATLARTSLFFFFTIAPYGAFLSGRACTLRCISARCLPSEGSGGAVRRWHQDLALLVATSYSRPRGRVRPCCCCALLVALLFFVVVIPQRGQLTFHASSSSARSIFIFFHGPTDTSVSCGGLPLCFPGRAVRER